MKYNYNPNRQLYVEVRDGQVGTKCIEALQEDIDNARLRYLIHEECNHHFIYDEAGFMYYERYCGICGKFIAHI